MKLLGLFMEVDVYKLRKQRKEWEETARRLERSLDDASTNLSVVRSELAELKLTHADAKDGHDGIVRELRVQIEELEGKLRAAGAENEACWRTIELYHAQFDKFTAVAQRQTIETAPAPEEE